MLHEKPMIASVSGFTGTYDLQSHGVSVEATDPINPKVEYSYDGVTYQDDEISYSDVGSYIIYYKLSADGYIDTSGNVTVQIKPVTTATVSFDQATYTKDYGDADPNFDVNFNGLVVGDSPVKDVDYVITRQTGETASATGYEVKFHWLRGNNYVFPETKTTLTINKAKDFKLVADPASKSGRAADPTFTAHAEGLKFKDELKPADYEVKASETNNPTTKTLTPSLTASGLSKFGTNYDLSGTYVTTADFDIYFEPGLKYKVNSSNGVYDAKDHVFSIDLVDTTLTDAKVLYSTDESHTTWKEDPPKFKNAGEYEIAFKITCEGYDDVQDTATLTIFKKDATIVADAAYKNEGEAEPELTAQVLGLVDGESLQPQVDYQLVREEGEAPGVYEIHCNLLSNAVTDNYNIETTDSKFFVLGQGTPTPTPDPPSPEEINGNVAQTGDNLANTIATVIAVIAILGCLSYLVLQVRRKQ